MECLRDYDYLNLLILPLQFLESQPFVSVQQVDDAAILEAVFLEDILQDMIIAMGIGTQVGYLAVTPLQAGGCYAFTVFRTCQTVDNAIRADIVYPFTVVDLHIGRVVSLYKGESSYDILFFIEAYRAPKSCTAPKKMPPTSTHSTTGSQPKAIATMVPVTGPAPQIELN